MRKWGVCCSKLVELRSHCYICRWGDHLPYRLVRWHLHRITHQ